MTELQKTFLFYTFLYFILKGALYVILYVALIVAEKLARRRHEEFLAYRRKKRADEQVRWKVAYSLYDKKRKNQEKMPLLLSQLIHNPNSFSAHSYVKPLV
ncbi:hypothetical protein [Syntrophomonas palmitatica]|uniref:hypothetical protein n=1 Tax=Syntrophomonas palmitatica TaxID=402877 RepID=UPI0006CFA495|nr:hypothetical protein [Syntrophomonas palmitatica]